MPTVVEIAGEDTKVEFPDSMSEDQIKEVLRRKFPKKAAPATAPAAPSNIGSSLPKDDLVRLNKSFVPERPVFDASTAGGPKPVPEGIQPAPAIGLTAPPSPEFKKALTDQKLIPEETEAPTSLAPSFDQKTAKELAGGPSSLLWNKQKELDLRKWRDSLGPRFEVAPKPGSAAALAEVGERIMGQPVPISGGVIPGVSQHMTGEERNSIDKYFEVQDAKRRAGEEGMDDEQFLTELRPDLDTKLYGTRHDMLAFPRLKPRDAVVLSQAVNDLLPAGLKLPDWGKKAISSAAYGLQSNAADLTDFFTTPEGLAVMASGGIAEAGVGVTRAAAVLPSGEFDAAAWNAMGNNEKIAHFVTEGLKKGFAADMAVHAPEQFNAAVDAMARGDHQEAAKNVIGGMFSLYVATHGAGIEGPSAKPMAPETLDQVRAKAEVLDAARKVAGAGAPATAAALRQQAAIAVINQKEADASEDTKTAEVHGDVQSLEPSASELPVKEGESGVQSQTGGGVSETQKPGASTEQDVAPKISKAAVRDESGNVFVGPHHPGILEQIGGEKLRGEFPTRESRNAEGADSSRGKLTFGFTDEKGNFLTRDEAAKRAKETGQQLESFDVDEAGKEQAHSNEIESPNQPGVPISESGDQQPVDRAIVSHDDLMDEVSKFRDKNKKAPPIEVIDDPKLTRTGTDGKQYPVQALWKGGKIVLNRAFLKDADRVARVLRHESTHPLLETTEGRAAVQDALNRGLGKEKMDGLRKRYAGLSDAQIQEEWFAHLAEEDPSLWRKVIERVREYLAKVGLTELTDEEIGRSILRHLRSLREATAEGEPAMAKLGEEAVEGKPVEEVIKGRHPEIQQGIRDVLSGKITKAEYNDIVQRHKPITPGEVPKPVTAEEMLDPEMGVKSTSRPVVGKGAEIPAGTTVGLRTDLPWKTKTGKAAVVVHDKGSGSKPGKVIAFEGSGRIENPQFIGSEKEAARIGTGESRTPFAFVQGQWSADQSIPDDVKDWTQVGFDPTRHSYFYDKQSLQPVIGGSEAVQIGNSVFVKDPKFGDMAKAMYKLAEEPLEDEHLNRKSGRWVGAPEWVKDSRSLGVMRDLIKMATTRGRVGRMWYEDSSKAIKNLVGGNVDEAEKMAELIGVFSPQNKVLPNMDMAIKAYQMHRSGMPREEFVKNFLKDRIKQEKAAGVLYDNAPWEGRKTNNFYNNLMREIDPSRAQGVTADLWVARAFGFARDTFTDRQYDFVEGEHARLAKELGWEPHQVQAALWTYVQHLWTQMKPEVDAAFQRTKWWRENQSRLKDGMMEVQTDSGPKEVGAMSMDNPVYHEFARDQFMKEYRRQGGLGEEGAKTAGGAEVKPTKFDFTDAIAAHSFMHSMENIPGKNTGILPEIIVASPEQKMEFHQDMERALHDEGGQDIIGRELGWSPLSDKHVAFSSYINSEGQIENNPATVARMSMPPTTGGEGMMASDAASKASAKDYAVLRGIMTKQEAVAGNRPFWEANKGNSNGVLLSVGRPLSIEEIRSVNEQLGKALGDNAWTVAIFPDEDGAQLVRVGLETEQRDVKRAGKALKQTTFGPEAKVEIGKFHKLAEQVAMELAKRTGVGQVVAEHFFAETLYESNDWKASPQAESYKQALSERAQAVLPRLESKLAPRIQAVYDKWGERLKAREPSEPAGPEVGKARLGEGPVEDKLRAIDDEIEKITSGEGSYAENEKRLEPLYAQREDIQRGLAESSRASAVGEPPFAPSKERAGHTGFVHYSSQEGLAELDPEFHGSGYAGEERSRRSEAPDNYIPRTYVGLTGYVKEPGLGAHRYEGSVKSSKVYDLKADPLDLEREAFNRYPKRSQVAARDNELERLVKERGFSGYKVGDVAALFDKVSVETQPAKMSLGEEPLGEDVDPGVAMKYRVLDEERAKRGLEPLLKPKSKTDEQVIGKAMREIGKNPDLPRALVKELNDKPRPIADWENHVLALHYMDIKKQFENAANTITGIFDKEGDFTPEQQSDFDSASLRAAKLSDELNDIEQASRLSGSERGRALRSLQVFINEQMSEEAMALRKRAANNGAPLSVEDRASIKKKAEEYRKQNEELQKHLDEKEARIAELESKAAAEQAVRESQKEAPQFHPLVLAEAEKLVKHLDKRATDALARIKQRRGGAAPEPKASVGEEPVPEGGDAALAADIDDLTMVGSSKLGHGIQDRADWDAAMIEAAGEWVKPHLDTVWERTQKDFEETLKKRTSRARTADVKKVITKSADVGQRIDAEKAKVKAKVAKGEAAEIHPLAYKLGKLIIERDKLTGADREKLYDALHPMLQEFIPDITRDQTIDAFSGIGIYKMPKMDDLSVAVGDLRQQSLLVGQADRLEKKVPVPRTGPQRRSMSDIARGLLQQVNELKRKYGITTQNPETALKTALQARETWYKHRLADLEAEIAAGERRVKTKTPSPTSPELEKLKAEYERVKAEHKSIFGERKMTDEQKLKMAIAGAERNEAVWNEKLTNARKGIYDVAKKAKVPLSSPELDAIKARIELAKNEVQELKDADVAYQENKLAKQLEASINEYQKKINSGQYAPDPKEEPLQTPRLQALRLKRLEMQRKLAELRAASPEQRALQAEALRKDIADLVRRINEGDLTGKPKSANAPVPKEIADLQGEKADLQKILRELQNATKPKKSPEEIANQRLRTRMANDMANLQEKIANKDFAKKPRTPVTLGPETLAMQAKLNKIRLDFAKELEQDRLKNRGRGERLKDFLLRVRRFEVLSSLNSIQKLLSYSLQKLAFTPVEEGIGTVMGEIPGIKQVFAKAPLHGRASLAAEIRYLKEAYQQGVKKDALQVLKKGESDLAGALDPHLHKDVEWTGIFGRLHLMEKSPLIRAAYERAKSRRFDWYARNNFNMGDMDLQHKIKVEAYQDALREALVNPNWISKRVTRFIRSLEENDVKTGKPRLAGKIASALIQYKLPVRNVPINYIARSMEYITGSVTGSVKLANAFRKGIDNLKPEEANDIRRHLIRGSIGAAAMLIGYYNPDTFGGYYQPGEKRGKDEAKALSVKIGDYNVPHYLVHNPLIEAFQFGATIRRVSDSKLRKKDSDVQGIPAGVAAAALGLADDAPYVRGMLDYGKLRDPRQRGRLFGDELRSALEPQLLQNLAQYLDKDDSGEPIPRRPGDIGENLMLGIPGLRQEVPEADKK